MRYREFLDIVRSEVDGLDVEDRAVSPFVRTAYESLPKGLNQEQQQKYAEVWASGYRSGRLGANMRSVPLLTGLSRKLAETA